MCKITFSHIIEENSLRKGLFQLIDNDEDLLHYNQDSTTDHSEESLTETFEDAKQRRTEQIQDEILLWFKEKHILSGNPEDLIYRHV